MYKHPGFLKGRPSSALRLLLTTTIRGKSDWTGERQRKDTEHKEQRQPNSEETMKELEREGRAFITQRNDKFAKRNEKQQAKELRHIYRATLRATTYLPDKFARQYMRQHIMQRYQKNSKKDLTSGHIMTNRLYKARRSCRILEEASFQNRGPLEDVLMRVYGRKGPRRRILIRDLLRKDEGEVPKDDEALQRLIATGHSAPDYEPGSKFFQFIHSQQANQPLGYRAGVIKKLQPTIPDANMWLRPMPKKAEKGIRQRWWAVTLDKIAPPVPLAEWERLEGFATGERKFDAVPPRRSSGRTQLENEDKSESPTGEKEKVDLHAVQRLYATIWGLTPTMKQNEVSKKWEITWGGQRSAAHNGAVSQPSEVQNEFFEGVESMEAPTTTKKGRGRGRVDQSLGGKEELQKSKPKVLRPGRNQLSLNIDRII